MANRCYEIMLVDHEREYVFPQDFERLYHLPFIALKKFVKRMNKSRRGYDERYAIFCEGRPVYSP